MPLAVVRWQLAIGLPAAGGWLAEMIIIGKKGREDSFTFRNFLRVVWKRPVRSDCSEMAAYAAMVLARGARCPVFALMKAVKSRGSQFLL